MTELFTLYFFIFGALIGSYLNVLILRLPKAEDTVTKRSHCTACGYQIKWYENIPIMSYLMLKGRCSECGTKISWQYPIVEIVTGILAVYLMPQNFHLNAIINFLVHFAIGCAFICHFVIDIRTQLLLDKINIFLFTLIFFYSLYSFGVIHLVLGAIIGFGFPLLVTWLFYKIKGQVGLGGGDIKLYGILGLYLGATGIIHNIFLSCFLGSLVGISLIALKKLDRSTPIAFGPFILIAGFFQIFMPDYYNQLMSLLIG
jgi:prepilin signal peptidase PulO-like enzyme (type II secretory pathway)